MDEQLYFQHNPHPLLVVDRESLYLLKGNERFFEQFEYSQEELDNRNVSLKDLVLPAEHQKLHHNIEDNGGLQGLDSQLWSRQAQNGDKFTVKIAAREISFDDYEAALVSIVDITGQLRDRPKLLESEKIFEKLFISAPQAIALVDMQNKVLKVNNSFENLFGYTARELVGNDLNNIIKADEGYKKAPKITDANFKKNQIYSKVIRYTKNGKRLDLVLGEIPIYRDGKLKAGFGIYIDITNQKETQRKLQQLLDEKQVLIEEVHHRVKNNLAVISGLLQMQTLHVDDERLTKYIRNSQLRIQSMAIVHEMLYKSKTLSHIKMDDYVQKLAAVITDTLSTDDKTIDTTVSSEDIMLNINQAIPAALIISELITSAYEYAFAGQKKGKVTVNLSKDTNDVSVSVSDDGVGLPENFEEMRQKSLGISLVENLCTQLETQIEINTGAWGTRFSFTFKANNSRGSSSSNRV